MESYKNGFVFFVAETLKDITNHFAWNCRFFEICRWNTTTSTENFTEKQFGRNFASHYTSYLAIALFKILPHSKTIKNAKKLSVFGEKDSCYLSNFLQTDSFWKFDQVSRPLNQINYRNIWFIKVIVTFIMAAQVFFFMFFFLKKTCTLMPLRILCVYTFKRK